MNVPGLLLLSCPVLFACDGPTDAESMAVTDSGQGSRPQEQKQKQRTKHAGHTRPPLPSAEEIAALPADGGADWNRLVFEQSPYLLQHAANPVDWYPWGEEAFAAAKAQNKPIFLSVGYSTCHWCHVMERESFEDPSIGALMNEHFVCIKVDREERPDVDHLYMNVTQSFRGSGGWPNTVFLTAEGKPFFAATYIPPDSRQGRKGMRELIPEVGQLWKDRREDLVNEAERVAEILSKDTGGQGGPQLGPGTLRLAYSQLSSRYDATHGGFGTQPKFPTPQNLVFLLQYHQRQESADALAMVEKTLTEMRRGGIYDHVGFGFHRYSTDARWFLPHFEKMLYDQALVSMAYVGAWQVTKKPLYRRTAEEIFTYVLRDMTSPEGGFYSAEDADSEGEEGLFYLWTPRQVRRVLGPEEGELWIDVFGLTKEGTYQEEASGHRTGRNIPFLKRGLADEARARKMPEDELRRRLEASRQKLFDFREERIHPLKDDKVLTDWNGLMIAALARAGAAFDEPRYVDAARRAADFLLAELRHGDRLFKRWRQGEAGLTGTLEDYAFASWGLLELYEACFEVRYLVAARELTGAMITHFADEKGGFFLSADDGVKLFLRGKEIYDGALPSGNSVAAMNLLRLGRFTGEGTYEEAADRLLRSFAHKIGPSPIAHTQALMAVDFVAGPSFEIVVAGNPAAEDTRAMLRAIHDRYMPNKVLVLRPEGESPITRIAPYTELQTMRGGRATAYVCQNFSCQAPTHDVATVVASLEGAKDSELLQGD